MKQCFKCNEPKKLTEFYKHKAMLDGHLNKCKSCTKADSKKREEEKRKDPVWLEAEKKRSREKYHRLNYKEKHGYANKTEEQRDATRKARIRYAETHPWVLNWKYKSLSRKFKVKKGLQLHHWCYLDESIEDVYVLDSTQHNVAHLFLTLDLEKLLFRTIEGVLLDTKIEHYLYLLSKGVIFTAYFPNPETQK